MARASPGLPQAGFGLQPIIELSGHPQSIMSLFLWNRLHTCVALRGGVERQNRASQIRVR